jgi:hypothetical protein
MRRCPNALKGFSRGSTVVVGALGRFLLSGALEMWTGVPGMRFPQPMRADP